MLLALGVITNITSAQKCKINHCKFPSADIAFSILENSGPSWVYKLITSDPTTCKLHLLDTNDTILQSESITVQNEFISKFSIVNLPDDFYVVILQDGTEIYRQQFSKHP